jgi:hypothetical protein
MLVEEAVDGGLSRSATDRNMPRFSRRFVSLAKKPLTADEPRAGSGREVEGQASVAGEPLAHLEMLLSGIIVEDHMDVAACYRAVEDVERGEQRQAMRLKPVRAPDALNGTDADADGLGHHRAGPMRRFGRRVLERQGDDPLGHVLAQRRDGGEACFVAKKAVEVLLREVFLPNAGLGLAGPAHHFVRPDAIGGKQDNLGPPSVLLRDVAVSEDRPEPLSIGAGNNDGNSRSKVTTPQQTDFRTTLGEFRKALPLESPAVLLIGRVFARALKERDWNFAHRSCKVSRVPSQLDDLPERTIEP